MSPGNRIGNSFSWTAPAGFNEAGTHESRKCPKPSAAAPAGQASMRPGLMSPGNVYLRTYANSVVVASMRPGLMSPGNVEEKKKRIKEN